MLNLQYLPSSTIGHYNTWIQLFFDTIYTLYRDKYDRSICPRAVHRQIQIDSEQAMQTTLDIYDTNLLIGRLKRKYQMKNVLLSFLEKDVHTAA